MNSKLAHQRNSVHELPLGDACNLAIIELLEHNQQLLQCLNQIIYQSETRPLDATSERTLVQKAASLADGTRDVIRELFIAGLLRRLRDQNTNNNSGSNDLTRYIIRLENYTIDINDVDEIIDESDDTITLNGYIDGEHQIRTLTGSEAQRVIDWFDQDYAHARQNNAGWEGMPAQRPRVSAYNNLDASSDDDSDELPF